MILEHLTVENFCLFGGEQVFALTPRRQNDVHRPIILFGGMNGGGKTTLLDAIQLALYGPRARCSNRGSLAYDEFLRRCTHRGAPPGARAGVTLSFRWAADGEEHVYDVARSWRQSEGRLREELCIYYDGVKAESLAENWAQFIEETFPLEISQLFFFDAEKIRTLAEDATSSKALGAAIKALLGLDLVERLIADAAVLQARLAKKAGPPEQRAEAEALEERLRSGMAELERLTVERADLENRLLRAKEELRAAEEEFSAGGGRHWEARQARGQRLGEVKRLAQELEVRLGTLAAGELPLALVSDLLGQVAEQDARERSAAEGEIIARLLADRDERLLETMRAGRAAPALVRLVAEHLEADRLRRQGGTPVERRLELSEPGRALLARLRGQELRRLRAEAEQGLEEDARLVREREDLERAAQMTPADAEIGRLLERLKRATEVSTLHAEQARRLDEAIQARRVEAAALEARLAKLAAGRLEREFDAEDAGRLLQLAGRTREAMQEFLRRVTERKIDRLAGLITESFRYLLRKQTLVAHVAIDPATFALTITDSNGDIVPRERLSEGEKQLFAIAVLWGLARAAARPLPTVIDTPMARLDATHRRHLVERYFPAASHQVILFSTDTEVDRDCYRLLQPHIARAYHLNYDEQTRLTVGEEGYFWKEAGA